MAAAVTAAFGWLAAAQLLVAASAKLSGYQVFATMLGRSRPGAPVLIATEIALGLGAATFAAPLALSLGAIAAFYAVGGVHRAVVVLSPVPKTCLCAHPGERTTWVDVLANVAMVSCAVALVVVDRPPPPPAGALGGVLAVAYLALWLRAELTFRRPQRLASRAGSRAHAQSA
jgi:hypothetical protein